MSEITLVGQIKKEKEDYGKPFNKKQMDALSEAISILSGSGLKVNVQNVYADYTV